MGAAGAIGIMAVPGVARASVADEPGLTDAERELASQSFVVHLRDVTTGEFELLLGEEAIVFTDKKLVARMLRAAR